MPILRHAALYFALVFAGGFLLGTLRVLLVEPALGRDAAEILESPVMVLWSFLVARWMARRFTLPREPGWRLGMGASALALLVAAELGVGMWIRGATLRETLESRASLSGAIYLLALAAFALMPWLEGALAAERGVRDA